MSLEEKIKNWLLDNDQKLISYVNLFLAFGLGMLLFIANVNFTELCRAYADAKGGKSILTAASAITGQCSYLLNATFYSNQPNQWNQSRFLPTPACPTVTT